MRKIIFEVEYFIKKYDLSNQKNSVYISSRDDYIRPLFCFKETKNTGLSIFNYLKQKKLIFNFFVNRNWKKKTIIRKRAKILAVNRKKPTPCLSHP